MGEEYLRRSLHHYRSCLGTNEHSNPKDGGSEKASLSDRINAGLDLATALCILQSVLKGVCEASDMAIDKAAGAFVVGSSLNGGIAEEATPSRCFPSGSAR